MTRVVSLKADPGSRNFGTGRQKESYTQVLLLLIYSVKNNRLLMPEN